MEMPVKIKKEGGCGKGREKLKTKALRTSQKGIALTMSH